MAKQKDNSTYRLKVMLRKEAMRLIDGEPIILETHGGRGRLFERCYDGVQRGTVIEKDDAKVSILTHQRPTWSVYQADSEMAIEGGAGSHLTYNLIDLDPYGSPFPTLSAIFCGSQNLADRVQLVVNDGLRQKVKLGGAWHVGCLQDIVKKRGNDLYNVYLAVARELVTKIVADAGFEVTDWHGYYCGHSNDMTHYRAGLTRARAKESAATDSV